MSRNCSHRFHVTHRYQLPGLLRGGRNQGRFAVSVSYTRPFFASRGNSSSCALFNSEPNDPSDVTEIIGSGKVDMGAKAMVSWCVDTIGVREPYQLIDDDTASFPILAQIHTIAGSARGFPIESIGTLMDEPFTGVVYLEGSGVTTDFRSLKGKKIGYVGEFGKIQVRL